MTPRQQGVAMLGLVGIAAIILYMHQAGGTLGLAQLSRPAPATPPAPPDNVYPLVAIGSRPIGNDQFSGASRYSWCGGVV